MTNEHGGDSKERALVHGPENSRRRTIFILYIPGGAMHGILPGMVMSRLEELTETHVTDLFQVFDGVSTGSILVAGMNIPDPNNPGKPKYNSHDGVNLFRQHGPRFFPEIPNRMLKMLAANFANVVQDSIDPMKQDDLQIRDINILCDQMRFMAGDDHAERIEKIRSLANKRWISRKDKNTVIKLCEALQIEKKEMEVLCKKVSELVFVRTSTSGLTAMFQKSALGIIPMVKNWASGYLFDSEVPKETYQKMFGDARMSQMVRSTYITAYDKKKMDTVTFFCRKQDFFSRDPNTPSETNRLNHKAWDAVMASTANPFAYRPHITEDGMICSDKATVHTPLFCVSDVMKHKPRDAHVKLVILGTGKYLSIDHDERDQVEYNLNYGVMGNLLKGEEMQELEAYTMAQLRHSLEEILGQKNIIEIMPRLAPHSYAESKEMPARDPLDASPDNVERITNLGHKLIVEQDMRIRELGQMLIDNLHFIGHMDNEKYMRITRKLDVVDEIFMPDPVEQNNEPEKVLERVFKKNSLSSFLGGIAGMFNRNKGQGAENDNKPPKPDKMTGTDGKKPKAPKDPDMG